MEHSTFVIVGLGNPGSQYAATRHNIGRVFLEMIIADHNLEFQNIKNIGHVFWIHHARGKTALLYPDGFMNTSGIPVRDFMRRFYVSSEHVCVVHDDLEKKMGTWRIKKGGSARGHNGLRSIISTIGEDFWRLGIGIDHPKNRNMVGDVAHYVLSPPSSEDSLCVQAAFSDMLACEKELLEGQFSHIFK